MQILDRPNIYYCTALPECEEKEWDRWKVMSYHSVTCSSPWEGSSSGPRVRGVLTEAWGMMAVSSSGGVLSWDWEEEEEDCVLSLELLRVSVLVLVFFIFLRLAKGALSTVWSRKPSRLHLLKAWGRQPYYTTKLGICKKKLTIPLCFNVYTKLTTNNNNLLLLFLIKTGNALNSYKNNLS